MNPEEFLRVTVGNASAALFNVVITSGSFAGRRISEMITSFCHCSAEVGKIATVKFLSVSVSLPLMPCACTSMYKRMLSRQV